MDEIQSDVTRLFSPTQTVLVSCGGSRFHLPSRTGNGPVCATTCDEEKGWNTKDYAMVDDFIDPCSKCTSVLEQSPKVVSLERCRCGAGE